MLPGLGKRLFKDEKNEVHYPIFKVFSCLEEKQIEQDLLKEHILYWVQAQIRKRPKYYRNNTDASTALNCCNLNVL